MPWVRKVGGGKVWVSAKRGRGRRMARQKLRRRLLGKSRTGYLIVRRKCPISCISSSAGVGVVNVPATTDMIQTGTPVASLGTVGNYYDVPFSFRFRFSHIHNPGEFSALFDQYKIKKVTITIQNNSNVVLNSTTAVPAGYMPYIEYIQDHDDANPLTPDTFREKMGIKTRYFNATSNRISFTVAPRAADEVEGFPAGATAFAIAPRRQWLNMAYTGVPHYGIKGVIRRMYLPAGANVTSLNVEATMTFAVKDIQ